MLVEFGVSNYRSIRERITLNAVASNDQTHPENLCEVPGDPKLRLLNVLAVYGANASGKSNLLNAMGSMRDFVLTSFGQSASSPARPFKLDVESREKPTEFEIAFVEGDQSFVYGFKMLDKAVQEEALSVRSRRARTKERKLFLRQKDGPIVFGPSWTGDKAKLAKVLRYDSLLLSVAGQLKHPIAELVVKWFRDKLVIIPASTLDTVDTNASVRVLSEDGDTAKLLKSLLVVADIGITDVIVNKEQPWTEDKIEFLAKNKPKLFSTFSQFLSAMQEEFPAMASPLDDIGRDVIHTLHKGADGGEMPFSMESEESAGTKKLFALAGPWIEALVGGKVIVVDELDTRLHPLITRFLISLFHAKENRCSQLLFATHDCGLLDAGVFRRDQVWFTEKNPAGATDLYSLWDYRVRKDENLRTGYLKGRYGAIPFVGEWNL